jgi:hypothetical protein
MIWLVLALALVSIVAFFAIYALATRRVAQTLGQPTPETAKIESKTIADARAVVNEGEQAKQEVLYADRDSLLSKLRDRVRGKK